MDVNYIKRDKEYDIPYISRIKGDESRILVVAHGFASSKESPNVRMLMSNLPENGIGVIALDFPGHGNSPVGGEKLMVDNCACDVKAVCDFVSERFPEAEICYFGSSFGAYVIMNYIMRYGIKGARVFMRSAAVDMHEFFDELSSDEVLMLEREGYIMLDYENVPSLKLTNEFVSDLRRHNLFASFDPDGNRLKMIHGSDDEDVDYSMAKAFAEKYDIDLVTVEGGDHRLSVEGAPEKVLEETLEFFA